MALGHPKGLFPLFFTEMWERLAFYTIVGILLLYATDAERGGLGLPAAQGNEIYGLYLAFVYFTPFLGGIIADRFLGYRRAVFVGGVMMASGLFLMGTPGFWPFTCGLIALIVGNGFFKPNISVMVGNLYEPGDERRDAGFNIFYMGINLGAFLATLYVAPLARNELGWLWTFRIAGCGLILAVVILLATWKVLARADRLPERNPEDTGFGAVFTKILLPALVVGILGYIAAKAAGYYFAKADLPYTVPLPPAVCGFMVGMIPVIVFFVRLAWTASPEEKPGLMSLLVIYAAGSAFWMILHLNGSAMTQWARDDTNREVRGSNRLLTSLNPGAQQEALPNYYVNAAEGTPRPDPRSLFVVDDYLPPGGVSADTAARMYGQQRMDESVVAALADALPRDMQVERFGPKELVPAEWSARATRAFPAGVVEVKTSADSHGGTTVTVEVPDGARPIGSVVFVRELDGQSLATLLIDRATFDAVYEGYRRRFGHEPALLPPGEFLPVINPEVYQTWNPAFVVLLTPVIVAFFGWRTRINKSVPTARKLLYGMLFATAGLLLMALAGMLSDHGTHKVSGLWLAGFYCMISLGELCLSPIGLSLVTKLSPKRLVGLTMGGWFLATAFGNNLSGFFGSIQENMTPVSFFVLLAGLSGLVAIFVLLLLPKLDVAIRKYGA